MKQARPAARAATGHQPVPTIAHAGELPSLEEVPAHLRPGPQVAGHVSCSYCGVGDSARIDAPARGPNVVPISKVRKLRHPAPTSGCAKLQQSAMTTPVAHPIHVAPSALDAETGARVPLSYAEAIERLAALVLAHRGPDARTLVYASGQIDYFAIFALQEVFRLLGVRNLTGNAEHCLNAGATHNELLTGQEGPFLTIEQATTGADRVYILSGWNGLVTHPPVYRALLARDELDAYLIEVMDTETAEGIARAAGDERVLFVRPGSDPHLALTVAHELLVAHPTAIDRRFAERFGDASSLERFIALARSPYFAPRAVARRIAAEDAYRARLAAGIRTLAARLADPTSVPIAIPSVGLSQSSGVVAHCVWGTVLALLGKYGLRPDGAPAGGVLRLPGQINAESEVQGLSRKYFVGRIPLADADEAATRMGLPAGAYERVLADPPRAALDYADPSDVPELLVCLGTQFEANMPNRRRWLDKLRAAGTTVVVIDPIPDPWTEANAALIIPSPPHPAATKLYQNGEWRLTLSVPQRRAAPETRSDATILYDLMAAITRRIGEEAGTAARHPDLAAHAASGYLQARFCAPTSPGGPGLARPDGEVDRAQLWERIQAYLHGGRGPLYCAFDHADGTPIELSELLAAGSLVYGGVGTTRFVLADDGAPFRDIYRRPGRFRYFTPTADDLALPRGTIFNSGRAALSDDRQRLRFATATFNSGKATSIRDMPDEHPLHVSPAVAGRAGLATGDWARVRSAVHGAQIELPVVVDPRVKGDMVYVSFHRSRAQHLRGLYVNDVTDDAARCPYSDQVRLKTPRVLVERIAGPRDLDA